MVRLPIDAVEEAILTCGVPLDWAQVQDRGSHFAPWTDEHLEFDTAGRPVEVVVEDVLANIGVI